MVRIVEIIESETVPAEYTPITASTRAQKCYAHAGELRENPDFAVVDETGKKDMATITFCIAALAGLLPECSDVDELAELLDLPSEARSRRALSGSKPGSMFLLWTILAGSQKRPNALEAGVFRWVDVCHLDGRAAEEVLKGADWGTRVG